MELIFAELFSTVIKLFALLTPPAVLSAFLGGTQNYGSRRKRRTALRTGAAVFIIGSGILLFLTAVAIMSPPAEAHTPEHADEDISIVPLALPICLGPASIGTLMVLGASADTLASRLLGFFSLFIASALITLMLLAADHVQRILGRTGLAVLAKLTGLLLAAIAAQVVFTGIKNFLIP